jgi:hypothetical protein
MEMNDALAKNFAPLTQLDEAFAQYAKEQAQKYAGSWDFTKPAATSGDASDTATTATLVTAAPAAANPHGYYARIDQIEQLMDQEEWAKARDQIKEINATGLYAPGSDNPYLMLAQVCNKLDDLAGEKEALTTVAAHEGDSWAAVSRLLEIAQIEKDYAGLARWGEASFAIHPMGVTAWRALLDAHEQRQENAAGVEVGLALLQLDPPDLASIHYRVAKMLQSIDPAAARRQVLQALEEAPRFRAAYQLLAALPPSPVAAATPDPFSDTPKP